jgi:hypothetical protein
MAVLSDQLDGKGKYVPDTTLGSYDARRTRIVLELAPEPKDLHIDAAIKHVFVNPRRLQEMLTGERSLRRIEECSQKRVLAFRQCDRGAARVRQASRATIELPTAKSAATLLQLLSRGDATRLPPTQYSPDARDEFAQTERLGHIVIGAEFQANYTIDLIASMTGYDDDRRFGTRSDLAQQIETVLLTELKVEDHHVRLARGELPEDLLSLRNSNDPYVLLFEIVHDHVLH